MSKEEFLQILKEGLIDFPKKELEDILFDYEEHFQMGFNEGKNDTEIILELGDPQDIVFNYRNGYLQKIEVEEPIQEVHFEEFKGSEDATDKFVFEKEEPINNNFYSEGKKEERYSDNNYNNYNNNPYRETKKKSTAITLLKILLMGLGAIFLLPILIVVFGLIVALGGVLIALAAVVFSVFFVLPWCASVAGLSVLIAILFQTNLGIFSVPAAILNLPVGFVLFITLGFIALSILSSMVGYYIIKLVLILISNFIKYLYKLIKGGKKNEKKANI